ncbi:Uncharacterized protein Fot_32224 [Forsythia ovata]|uniref:Uncharacterized protein n=1 Tax=Forsythia ovata TaxID=205694 RepID=A0ABD1T790_9LAMI
MKNGEFLYDIQLPKASVKKVVPAKENYKQKNWKISYIPSVVALQRRDEQASDLTASIDLSVLQERLTNMINLVSILLATCTTIHIVALLLDCEIGMGFVPAERDNQLMGMQCSRIGPQVTHE